MKKAKLVSLVLTLLFFSGCASIVSKSKWPVTVRSNPSGAKFYITDSSGTKIHQGKTPSTVVLSSKKGYFQGEKYKLLFMKDGYGPTVYELKTSLNGWYVGNLIFGGLIGLVIVDPITGAMYRLDDQVNVSLRPDVTLTSDNSELRIVTLDNVPRDLRDQLIAL